MLRGRGCEDPIMKACENCGTLEGTPHDLSCPHEWRRQTVVKHLSALAERIRTGQILSIKYEWDVLSVSIDVTLLEAPDFIPISIHLLDRKRRR